MINFIGNEMFYGTETPEGANPIKFHNNGTMSIGSTNSFGTQESKNGVLKLINIDENNS